MPSIRDDVNALLSSGRARAGLSALVRNWRECPTPYTIENAIRLAVEKGRGDDLHDTILDEEFRNLRRHMFGVDALRADLHLARTYNLTRRPDLLRYVQVLLVEQRPFGTPESVLAQQQHCHELAEFLQIDRLPHERLDIGLHGVLMRFFPDTSGTALRLAGYELGDWRCSCGRLTGLARRYDHACPCTAVSGHGRITEAIPRCPDPTCAGPVDYAVCPACRTRVTLANLWRVRRGGAGPDDFLIPFTLDLVTEDQGTVERARHLLMHLPLPVGLRERHGEIAFDAPTVFWTSAKSEPWPRRSNGDRFLGLKDTLRYDGRTQLRPILEALLRRTLLGYRKGYARFTDELLQDVLAGPPGQTRPVRRRPLTGTEYRSSTSYTHGFWDRLQRVTVRDLELGDLVSRGAVSAQCTVVASPRLRGTAALVNERLADPHALTVPTLVQLDTTLPDDAFLTPGPPTVGGTDASTLDKCGLIAPGRPVRPGQLLVGAASPVAGETTRRTPEERLLYFLFGDRALRDRSLAMSGRLPGHVLEQRITGALATDAIPAAPGRKLRGGGSGTHITVTVAVDQPVQHGDRLDDGSGASVVVCGLAGGPSLRRLAGSAEEPDLIVAPDHPWAPPAGEAGRTVRVRLAAHGLAGSDTGARSAGGYSLVLHRPLWRRSGDGAQLIEPEEFRRLIECGARHLALEIYGSRGDCPGWRKNLRTSLESRGEAAVPPARRPAGLYDAPPHAIRRFDLTLRAARIEPRLQADRIGLRLMTDADVVRLSHGVVVSDVFFDARTGRPWPGGLFCERIFGPDGPDGLEDCVCGKPLVSWGADDACDACGRPLAMLRARGHRFGHIELPVPVVHSWCLSGTAGALLARSLQLTGRELRQLADCELVLITDPGPTALRTGQLLNAEDWMSTVDRARTTAVTGGQAVGILLRRAGTSVPAGLSPDTVLMQRLPVLPPDLRPHVVRADGGPTFRSDLNTSYSAVLSSAASLRRLDDMGAPPQVLMGARRLLQRKVGTLLDNGGQPEPTKEGNGRKLIGLADSLKARPDSTGSLRDDYLRRPVDYSARARLVIARLPDPAEDDSGPATDTVLLGRDLVLRLVEPLLVHALTSSGVVAHPWGARPLIENRAEDATRLLDSVCEHAWVLVAFPHGPRRLVALRLRAAGIPALQVQPGLLDLVGWKNLGEPVRIFSVLTEEAVREATDLLTVDAPPRPAAPGPPHHAPGDTLFDLPCDALAAGLADAALSTGSLPLSQDDGLLLCDPQWPGRPFTAG
ncbi:hypothetical protein [Streptomyces sp. SP2-10]|uniref:hypothetical protein n=1 Tax=Streptomyces sp. SP2-10 TaxID=2873385 RepID=UPI001CA704F2|nr:hypothetical protein [Streptomyces sp. SP2-10]MBY8846216.1 hypothetical protein [Streptomyces sp. SP2-10]